jgi:peptidoglycan/LPS O-acetylase OafA/YrhL
MRSSSGVHYIALDHVRALAAFMVFTSHFIHGLGGSPVPHGNAPIIFPLALLDEGQTGVALFMTLSGYLFAKLLGAHKIDYRAFFINRALRLLPMLFVMLSIVGIWTWASGVSMNMYEHALATGLVLPSLPNGGWSITVEIHYYLILPAFLWMLRKSQFLPFSILAAAILLRTLIFYQQGEVQSLAYFTLVGRIDQFALGMIIYQFRACCIGRHMAVAAILTGFALFYWYFDSLGGYNGTTHSPLWILLPTMEGAVYAMAIAWYEGSFSHSLQGASKFIGHIGVYSYSIYLLHMFVVFIEARFVNENIMDISNFYLACAWSLAAFLLMMPAGYLCYRYIEKPFLRLRRHYIVASAPQSE